MKTLSAFLTRDMSLIAVECWYDGKARVAREYFGFEQPACGFMHQDGVFKYFSDMNSFDTMLPGQVSTWLKKNGDKLQLSHKYLIDGLNFWDGINISDKTSLEELVELLRKSKELFTVGYIGVLLTHHMPIWYNEFKEKGESIFDEETINMVLSWREAEGNVFFNGGINNIYALLGSVAEKEGWDSGLLKYIGFEELKKSIDSGELPLETLEKRAKNPFFYFDYKILYEPDIKPELTKLGYSLETEKTPEALRQLLGRTACPGRVVGYAKIVRTKEDTKKVLHGDVIISPMTTPDMIHSIERAVAIVTDEGGITSHAAVMSREMNVPCIVGTKSATKLFKDGDLIEVDANKGTVSFSKI